MAKEKDAKKDTKVVTKVPSVKDETKAEKKGKLQLFKKGTTVQNKKKENKKGDSFFTKMKNYFKDVKQEMKKVKWPSKKEMALYSGATVGFILIFALFFSLNDLIISAVKQLVR